MKRISPSLALAATLAAGLLTADARAAGLLIADGGFGGTLAIREQDVRVTIDNGIAVTTVDQVFRNTEQRVVEALYTFPVPRGASVSNFSMWIDGKEMVGEVVEKKRAREIYESYKQTRRDPGLLEQVDYRTFEMRIFPIAAGAEQRVQITYHQELDVDHDRATYVYPLATTTRPGVNARTEGRFAVAVDVRSEIPIVAVESPSHEKEFAIARHADGYQQASLETRGGDLSRDVVLSFQTSRPRTGLDLLTSKQDGEDGYFALTLTPGEELKAIDAPMDYVFVLDVSGSMGQDGKLATSRRALAEFVETLGTGDRFEIVSFNVQPRPLFGRAMPADEASRAKARAFLDAQRPAGGTVLKSAMATAYKYATDRPLNVIVLSDGLTEHAERRALVALIGQRPKDARVFAIGVGNDVNRPLLEQLATDSGGLAAFVSNDDNLTRQAQAFRRKLLRPIATDVAIRVDGAGGAVEAYDLQPATLPNLYHGSPIRVYGRYKGDGDAKVTVSATAQGVPLAQGVEMTFPARDDANPQIERMWAWKKIDGLLKGADAAGSRDAAIPEVVLLGEGYSIMSEHTSFLVLENDAEYRRWKIDQRNATRMTRDRGAQERVAGALEKLRDAAAAGLGPAGAERLAATPAAPPAATPALPAANDLAATPAPARGQTPRNRDLNIGRGGGAFGPWHAAALVAGGAGIAFASSRLRRSV